MGTTRVACIKASSPCHSRQQPRLPATHQLQRPCERRRARAEKKIETRSQRQKSGGRTAGPTLRRASAAYPPLPAHACLHAARHTGPTGDSVRVVFQRAGSMLSRRQGPPNRHELVLRGPLGAWLRSSRVDARMNDRRPFNLGGQLVFLSRFAQLESILLRTREL